VALWLVIEAGVSSIRSAMCMSYLSHFYVVNFTAEQADGVNFRSVLAYVRKTPSSEYILLVSFTYDLHEMSLLK